MLCVVSVVIIQYCQCCQRLFLCLPGVQNEATALHFASANGSVTVMRALLEAGAKVRALDKVARVVLLHGCCASSCHGALRKWGCLAAPEFCVVWKRRHPSGSIRLCRRRAAPAAEGCLDRCPKQGAAFVPLLCQSRGSCFCRFTESMRRVTHSVVQEGMTPLHVASAFGRHDVIKLLMPLGVYMGARMPAPVSTVNWNCASEQARA